MSDTEAREEFHDAIEGEPSPPTTRPSTASRPPTSSRPMTATDSRPTTGSLPQTGSRPQTAEDRRDSRRLSHAQSGDSPPPPVEDEQSAAAEASTPLMDGEKQEDQEKQVNQEKQVTQEKQERVSQSTEEDDFPEGGRRAWLVAAGTASILFCSLGYTNSFGVFQAYYAQHQLSDQSPDHISWIGSIQAFLVFASGAIGGPVFDRYGAWVIRPATVVYVFSIMMTSLCSQYWQFMLAQGVLGGISNGLIMFPAMAATPQYFSRRRGAAMGVAIAGSSVGAVIFPIVLSELLDRIGFGWAVRTCGFVMMPLLLFSSIAVRARLPPRKTRFFLWSAFRDPLYCLLIAGVGCMFVGMFIPFFYLPTFGIAHGMDNSLASYLVAVVNGASVPGRIVPGILGDRVGRINILICAGLTTGISILSWTRATTNAGIIVFAACFGLTSGAIISGGSVVFTLCPKSPKDIGTYMGMGIALASVAVLIGPPSSGALLNRYHGFTEVSIFGGVMVLVGTAFALMAKCFSKEGVLGLV